MTTATATPAYTFERVARDCGANADAIAAGGQPLFFDVRVMLAGEHVATFVSESRGSSGYRLYDRANRAIVQAGRTWSTHLGEYAKKKADFEALLASVHVPTAAEIAERARSEAAAALAKRRADADAELLASLHRLEAAICERIELDTQEEPDYSLLDQVRARIKRRGAAA